jgi:hypothetical protein
VSKTLSFGSPSSGWPSFCPDCGRRADLCEKALADRVAQAGRRSRLQRGRSMELDPKPTPV